MKKFLILTAVAASASLSPKAVNAAINGADARGYYQRGVAMYFDKNYNGCIDQLLHIRNLNMADMPVEDIHYYFAMATLHSGDDEAIDLLENFLATYPQSPRLMDVTMTIGDYYFTRGSYGEALDNYEKVDPEALTADRFEDLVYRKAYSYMMLGESDRAEALFMMLTDRRYGNAAIFYRGYLAYSRRDYSKARSMFMLVNPDQEPGQSARYYLCQLDFIAGDYAKAADNAVALLRQGTSKEFTPELQRIAGESLYNLGQTNRALPYLRQYVANEERPLPSACYILGVDDYRSGLYEQAIGLLQKAAGDTDATGQSAYLYLGKSYVKTSNTNGALLAFEKASKMNFDPNVTETASYDYIVARLDGGRAPFSNSVEMLENFLTRYPRSQYANNVRENLAMGYLASSDYDNALRVLDAAANPSQQMLDVKQQVLLMIGSNTFHSGDTEKALDYFLRGAETKSTQPSVTAQCRLWAANCLYDLKHYDQAADNYLDYLNMAPANDQNRLSAYYGLGYTRINQQRYDDALKDFVRVADNSSADAQTRADALNRAGDCLYCQRKFAQAADYYKKAYDTYPQAGDYALFQMAEMSGLQRDYSSRIATIDRMLSQFPSSALVPDALMAKAESMTIGGQTAEAATIYRHVADNYPTISQGRRASLMLAMNAANDGRRADAIEAYKDVVATYPTSQEARVALDDLRNLYANEGRLPDYVAFVNSIPELSGIEMSDLESTAYAAAEERYIETGNTDRLLDYLTQFDNGQNAPAALLYLAEEAADNDKAELAESYAIRITSQYPDSEEAEQARLIKADSELAQGKGEIALESYRELAGQASTPQTLHQARMGMLTTAIELGRYDDALEASDRILASSMANTDVDQVEFYRALALDRTGRHAEAHTLWEQLAKRPATLYGSKSAVYLAQSLMEAGELKRAEKVADQFIDAGSPHNYWYARGFIVYSDILRRQGKDFEADEYLKALKENYPGNETDIFDMISSRLEK